MSDIAIRVEGLSKRYQIGTRERYSSLRDTMTELAAAPFRRLRSAFSRNGHGPDQDDGTLWALKDVSFEVKQGEVLGIIGRNGAGKSTLLKILSRITEPTEGHADVYGRVGALLEVGTGFHPELTGRENIYLNGAILGMSHKELNRKFDEIVAFAEVERFLDTPAKHYSTGMYIRLAFAVAAHLEPEILVVDEVLAVGDAVFQKKCLGKMGDVASEGRTVLLVSHNMLAVGSLCSRAIWLYDGHNVADGTPSEVISTYLKTSSSSLPQQLWENPATAPGNGKVRLHRACIRPENGSMYDPITIRTSFTIEFDYWNLQQSAYLNLALYLYNQEGVMVFSTASDQEPVWHGSPFPVGLFRSTCRVPGDLLLDGTYQVTLLVVQDQGVIIHREDEILAFDIEDVAELRGAWFGKWPGVMHPLLPWHTELLREL